MGKRKHPIPEQPDESPPTKKSEHCIIHCYKVAKSKFTLFSDLKEPDARLQNIQRIRDRRLAEEKYELRMEDACRLIPDKVERTHGYHRECYQQFTKNLDRLQSLKYPSTSVSGKSNKQRQQRKHDPENIIIKHDCIFCNRDTRISVNEKGKRTTQGLSFFTFDGGENIKEIAKKKNDSLHRRLQNYDLSACEARYHPKCRKDYTRDPSAWKSKDPGNVTYQEKLEEAHSFAFEYIFNFIQNTIVIGKKIVPLSTLRLKYTAVLDQTNFPSPNYDSRKLKQKIEKHPVLGSKIVFTKVESRGTFPFYLVYSSDVSTDEAIQQVYKMSTQNEVKDVALLLRGVILKSFRESKEMPWPPSPSDLEITNATVPPSVHEFFSYVLCGKPTIHSERTERIILSIAQDVCRAATGGEWKLPKHVLLCMTLRHMFRSKKLINIMNRLGHSENYDFSLEMETAVATVLEQKSSFLTPEIQLGQGNALFHSEWDNFDALLTGMHSRPSVHMAAGIMLQETTGESELGEEHPRMVLPRTKEKSLSTDPPVALAPFHLSVKRGPHMNIQVTKQPQSNINARQNATRVYLVWLISRLVGGKDKQSLPGFGGFVSATGTKPSSKTTVGYYPSINEPITESNVVREVLRRCKKATEEVQQKYTIVTFDLGVVMKAMPIIWHEDYNNSEAPQEYNNHIILIGTFHVIMNYLNMIGKKMAGSGYAEIITEANLTTAGCLRGVMTGKHFNKSIWCLKTVCEAFERLLLDVFIEQRTEFATDSDVFKSLITIVCDPSSLKLNEVLAREHVQKYLHDYIDFKQEVRHGKLGKTAQFWLSFLDCGENVFMLLYAVKINSVPVYHTALSDMAPLFFSFGGMNYSRYLTWFDMFLLNIDHTHPGAMELIKKGAISVARSLIPGNRCQVDKTIEETFMKFSKSSCGAGGAGVTGLLENYGAYQRWVKTTSERAKYFESTLEMCGFPNSDEAKQGRHYEQSRPEIERSEAAVQRTIRAIKGFLNPFAIEDTEHLYVVSSGCPVPTDVADDVLMAGEIGCQERDKFIDQRLRCTAEEQKDFFDRIKQLKLKTMEHINKVTKFTNSRGKIIQVKEQGDLAFQLLVKSQLLAEPISIEEMMTYSLTPIPHCLGTPDGFMAKTNKASAVRFVARDSQNSIYPSSIRGETLYIEDGNAIFHTLKELQPTFELICLQVLDRLAKKPDVVFSTDSYKQDSIKAQERLRRGVSKKFIIEGIHQRKPADFKLFLQNDENKVQLINLMERVWIGQTAAKRLQGKKLLFVNQGVVLQLTSEDGKTVQPTEIHELRSNQEETDSRIILYLNYARENNYKQAVVSSPDSDVFFILLHHAHQLAPLVVLFDTGSGSHKRLYNMSEMAEDLGETHCDALLGLYCFTGEDCNCAFRGKGKVIPMRKLDKKPMFKEVFAKLGSAWSVQDDTINKLEQFVCYMYGFPRMKSVNAVRALMLKKMVGETKQLTKTSRVDFARLPPCRQSLVPHILRVNYRVRQWKMATVGMVEIPPATDHGWVAGEMGLLEPVWTQDKILPSNLEDLIEASTQRTDDDQSDDEVAWEDDSDLSEVENEDENDLHDFHFN